MERALASAVFTPPFTTVSLPGSGGAIGPDPEDFRVDEQPAYQPSGQGEHCYVRIQKRGLTTPEAVRRIAEAAEVDIREIGYAGLKDKHAVTTQWLSLPVKSAPPEQWKLPEQLSVLDVSRHTNKLRTGHLVGNHFSIALVGLREGARPLAEAIALAIQQRGLPNYFGMQRFGFAGENFPKALTWLREGGRKRLSPFLLKLYPSVVQSEVFNRYLSLRANEGMETLLPGDVVRLSGSGASFVVEDAERENPRLESRDVHLTGPMLGPKMRSAAGRPLELELLAKSAVGIDERIETTLGRFAPGARRDLLVFPEALAIAEDGPGRLRLDFGLPAGSYATLLIREFTRSAWLGSDTRIEEGSGV